MNIFSIYRVASSPFRKRRFNEFLRRFAVTTDTRILDVGGLPETWDAMEVRPKITLLNLAFPDNVAALNMNAVVGDATQLPFDDNSFDIVFSNSVIEHLYSWENQQKFAAEVRRVGRNYSVQTPNRKFPIEPHYLTPGIHFVPPRIRVRMLRYLTVWGLVTRPDRETCEKFVKEIRLLSIGEMEQLFPEAIIRHEKALGMTKSFTATYIDDSDTVELK